MNDSQDIFEKIAKNCHRSDFHVQLTREEEAQADEYNRNLLLASEEMQPTISKYEAKKRKYATTNLGASTNRFLSSIYPEEGENIKKDYRPYYPGGSPKVPVKYNFWQAILQALRKIRSL